MTTPVNDIFGRLYKLWWEEDAIKEHGRFEADYDAMYSLWHQTELEFWTPLVGEKQARRFGYSATNRAWCRVKRISTLDRGVPVWKRMTRFMGFETSTDGLAHH